ncbi:tRNA lysidine(34) synthetase TilS [Mesorhizobium microcysteis]|uniref:tRNA(Ile)-lysidine synthase n=1 Tax=Neoaquamicrobium microcysteis TaxID=2682781 RepID=A0A5D4H2S7_9HYPH|nr:tRNA lysidine(34) synthetase TilS [Mesorhizobium microcysteis]TYR34563.1 tRNA lysidine(34) synthetase TilS [Mesorhizobium microcysteis]
MGLDLARLFGGIDIDQHRRFIVAVSGGSDSLALLLLFKSFLDRKAPRTPLLAVTVDHGLRPEAAAEARAVAALCNKEGIAHRTMVWDGEKPSGGIIAAAREARYDLLALAADEFGADVVLTAHTMDDQAETVSMRLRRASGGGSGIAGMARATLFDERIWIVRPLLAERRQALRDYLADNGIAWIDDPTNDNHTYERVRVRAELATADTIEELAAQAARAGTDRSRLSRQATELIERFVTRPAPGLYHLSPQMFAAPDQAAVQTLRIMLATAGGMAYLPDLDRTTALARQIAARTLRATLSRAVIDARRSGIWIRREARGLPAEYRATDRLQWDGRWRLATTASENRLRVSLLGGVHAKEIASTFAGAPESLVAAALSLEPALFDGDRLIGLLGSRETARCGVSGEPVAAPHARFLPAFDLTVAHALRRILNRPPLPSSPWNKHIAPEA